MDKPATAPRKKCPRGKEKKNYVYVEKTSYHKGKNWIKGEKVRAAGGEKRKNLCTRRKPAIIRGKNWIKGEKVRAEGGGKRKNLCIPGENQLT